MKGVHLNGIIFQSESQSRPRGTQQHSRYSGTYNDRLEDNFSFFVYSIPCILSVLCYSNVLNGEFVHDDIFAIRDNPDVTGKGNLSDIWVHDFWGKPMSSVKSHKSYRPLTILLFSWLYISSIGTCLGLLGLQLQCGVSELYEEPCLNLSRLDYLLSQGNPTWFHIVNIFLHACVTCLVAHVTLRILKTSELSAVLASSLFAVHPIHTEAVSSIVGRADVLAAVLFLLSFVAYARCIDVQDGQTATTTSCSSDDDQSPHPSNAIRCPPILLATSLVLAVAASLCKETGFTVLAVCVLYDLLQHGHLLMRMGTVLTPRLRYLCQRLVAVAVTGVLFLASRAVLMDFQVPIFQPEDNPASYSDSFLTRALTFNYLLPFNVWLLVCPSVLCYDWSIGSIPLVESLTDPRNFITLAFYVTVIAMVCSGVRSLYEANQTMSSSEKDLVTGPSGTRASILTAGVLMCVPFIPASNLMFYVGFVVAERVLYIPSIGFCILLSQSIVHLCESIPRVKGHALTLAVLLIITFAGKTWHRNPVWTSRKALFLSGIQTMPTNAKVHFNIANYYKDTGDSQKAIDHYKKAIYLYPHHPSYHNNLGTLLTNRTESEDHFRQALTVQPKHKGALVNLGNLMLLQGQDEGFDLLRKALEIDPEYIDAILSMGKALMLYKRPQEAEEYIKRAIELQPDLSEAHVHYGALHHQTGRLENAVTEYQQAFTLNSRNTKAMKNAAISLRKLRRFGEAEMILKRALSLQEDSDMLTQLGILYSEMGQTLDALFAHKEALVMAPNDTLINLRYIQSLVDTNQHSAANQSLTSLLERASRDLDVLRFAYTHKQRLGLTEEAFPYLEEAILQAKEEHSSSLGKLYHDKADIYRQRSDFDNSLKFYKMSVAEDSTLVESYINIGTIYHIKANYSGAEEFYTKALALNPVNKLAKENLTKLRNIWKGSRQDKR